MTPERAPAPEPSFTGLVRVRHNPWIMGLAASPLLVAIAGFFAGILVTPHFFALMVHPPIIAFVLLLWVLRRNPRPVRERVALRFDEHTVDVGGERIPRAEIRGGLVRPTSPPRVLLRRRRALPVELETSGVDEARGLLRALGLDASQAVATFRTLSRAAAERRFIAYTVGGFGALYAALIASLVHARSSGHAGLVVAAGLAFVLGLVAMMITFLAPTRLSIGADGVALRWLGRDRFIGYGDVLDVSRYVRGFGRSKQIGLTVTLTSGEKVALPIGQRNWSEANVALIEERLREARETFHAGGTAADAALLQRGARPTADWLAALRAVGSGANADLRTAPVPRERLFRIVESPAAAAADRAAAAMALGVEPSPDDRARLRSAAEAIAAPRLRIAIEAAATGAEDDELRAALEAVAEDEAKATSR